MLIKLTHPKDYIEYSLNEDEQNPQAEHDDGQSGIGPGREMGKRQLLRQYARELLSQDVIFDAILFYSSPGSETL